MEIQAVEVIVATTQPPISTTLQLKPEVPLYHHTEANLVVLMEAANQVQVDLVNSTNAQSHVPRLILSGILAQILMTVYAVAIAQVDSANGVGLLMTQLNGNLKMLIADVTPQEPIICKTSCVISKNDYFRLFYVIIYHTF